MGQTQGGSAGNLELLEKIKEQQAEIDELKAVINEKLTWKFLSLHDLSTTDVKINIPETAREVLIFAGAPNQGNEFQVYGGKSYIIPQTNNSQNIVFEKNIYDASDSTKGSGFYAMLADNILTMHVKTTPVRARVYYR